EAVLVEEQLEELQLTQGIDHRKVVVAVDVDAVLHDRVPVDAEPVARLRDELWLVEPPGLRVGVVIEEVVEHLHPRQRSSMGELHAVEDLLTRHRSEPVTEVVWYRHATFGLVELDVFEPATCRQLVLVVESALVVVAEDDRDVALGLVDVALEPIQLADLSLRRPPEVVGVVGVERLFAPGVGVVAPVLVVHQIADAHDLIPSLDDRLRRLERRGACRRRLEHPPQFGPLTVHVTDGDDLDHRGRLRPTGTSTTQPYGHEGSSPRILLLTSPTPLARSA